MDDMRYTMLALLPLLASCGANRAFVAPEFKEYVQRFEKDYQLKVDHVPISFGDITNSYMGMCYIWNDGRAEVHINKEHWDAIETDAGREELIYHELGHCVFLYEHNEGRTLDKDGYLIETSIMNPYWFGDRPYYNQYERLYKEALKENNKDIDL